MSGNQTTIGATGLSRFEIIAEKGDTGLWYVTSPSMHSGLIVIGRSLSETLARVGGVWVELQLAELACAQQCKE